MKRDINLKQFLNPHLDSPIGLHPHVLVHKHWQSFAISENFVLSDLRLEVLRVVRQKFTYISKKRIASIDRVE
jgi:hypothetical protein